MAALLLKIYFAFDVFADDGYILPQEGSTLKFISLGEYHEQDWLRIALFKTMSKHGFFLLFF